jgi:hypothetical protein
MQCLNDTPADCERFIRDLEAGLRVISGVNVGDLQPCGDLRTGGDESSYHSGERGMNWRWWRCDYLAKHSALFDPVTNF